MGFKRTKNNIDDYHQKIINDTLHSIQQALELTMRELVIYAKSGQFMNKNWKDQSSALRNSIGYHIYYNGQLVASSFSGPEEGVKQGDDYAKSLIDGDDDSGFICVFVAGMNYALYVESKGFGVISGPALQFDNVFKNHFDIIKNNLKK